MSHRTYTVPNDGESDAAKYHVHLLARFGRTINLEEWVKELKRVRVSNLWLKERGRDYADFRGAYADFSVSPSNL